MKVAMWALGIFALSIFGLVLINTFGNITVTNQLNYTTMKNAVEAAMYDSLDIAHYRSGFCLCTNLEKSNDNGKTRWVFKNSNQYEITDIVANTNPLKEDSCAKAKNKKFTNCEIIEGEYKINPTVFSESLVRRFAEMVNNNKAYEITIQDVIEYPPKVSVRVDSEDGNVFGDDGYTISNQVDALLEVEIGD